MNKAKVMDNKMDHPGIYIPPPLIYVLAFFGSGIIQKTIPLNNRFFHTTTANILGTVMIIAGITFLIPAIQRFIKSRNSLITIKPANSLQIMGIYAFSRNPMYLSLLLLYSGISFLFGNWWCVILVPVLFLINQEYFIKREEAYLERKFGQAYVEYKAKVRRWL